MQIMKLLLFLSFFLLTISMVYGQDCVVPKNDMRIQSHTTLCPGTYSFEQGISLAASGITLDCDGASIRGKGLGYGVLIQNQNGNVVINCNISNFEAGIYLEEADGNGVAENYIFGNRFGIATYGGTNNDLRDNVLIDNSRSDTIEVVPIKLFPEEVLIEDETIERTEHTQNLTEGIIEQKPTPIEVFEKAVTLKNPDYDDSQVAAEVEGVFEKFFNATQEDLDFQRKYIFNSTDNTTKVILKITPKRTLRDVAIYESIPKCLAQVVEEISFTQENYEVIERDPLIVWHFDEISDEKLLTYTVFKRLDESCRELLLTFGIATGNVIFDEPTEEKKGSFRWYIAVAITFFVIVLFVLFNQFRK